VLAIGQFQRPVWKYRTKSLPTVPLFLLRDFGLKERNYRVVAELINFAFTLKLSMLRK
jgi:hypothetical protein